MLIFLILLSQTKTLHMKVLFFSLLLFSLYTNAQTNLCGTDKTFYNESVLYTYAPPVETAYAIVNNSYDNPQGQPISLKMDIYVPNTGRSSNPLIVLMHGGGFRTGCKNSMGEMCKLFAERGFVAVSINYRLGWVPKQIPATECTENGETVYDEGDQGTGLSDEACVTSATRQQMTQPQGACNFCDEGYEEDRGKALYRAVQDAHAAIRFLTHYASSYGIDINNIYVGGNSAGSIAAVTLAYMQQADMTAAYSNAKAALGRIDNSGVDPISQTVLTDAVNIRGVFNNWGGIINTNYIEDKPKDRIPMIAFHGKCDNVVPYVYGHPNLDCQAYTEIYGSKAIYDHFDNFTTQVSHVLYSRVGGHGILECKPEGIKQRAICAVKFFRSVSLNQYVQVLNECINDYCNDTGECDSDCLNSPGSIVRASEGNNTLKNIRLFPNPAHNFITYTYTLNQTADVFIQITNATNVLVFNEKKKRTAGSYTFSIPISSRGIFHFTIKANDEVHSKIFVSTSE